MLLLLLLLVARRYYRRTLAINEREGGPESTAVGNSYSDMGEVYNSQVTAPDASFVRLLESTALASDTDSCGHSAMV